MKLYNKLLQFKRKRNRDRLEVRLCEAILHRRKAYKDYSKFSAMLYQMGYFEDDEMSELEMYRQNWYTWCDVVFNLKKEYWFTRLPICKTAKFLTKFPNK